MTATGIQSTLKDMARAGWRAALNLSVHGAQRPTPGDRPRVFFGGARSGEIGGPLVKVKRLQEHFPEHRVGFNTVYVLSNAPYLGPTALRRLKHRGVALIHNQNGVFYPAWHAGDWQAENRRMAEPYHLADYVFWQSDFCRRVAERFLGPRHGPGEILYNAVDTDRFRPPAGGPHQGRFRFLITGKFFVHQAYALAKVVESLALAVADGLDAELAFAGRLDRSVAAAAKAIAEENGIVDRLLIAGPYTQQDAPAVYAAAHAYVTTRYMDNCPNSVIEALATGLPVVFSASGGVPELVGPEAGSGITVPEDFEHIHVPEPRSLADAMLEVAQARARMSEAARKRAITKLDIHHWIDRHGEVFAGVLNKKS